MDDEYQKRYLVHQQFGKKDQLIAIMKERHSQRQFGVEDVTDEQVQEILDSCRFAQSSCDRFGVRIKVTRDRDDKCALDGLAVGATGWLYRSNVVLMLLADPKAYKANDEINFMPYLDAGILVQQISLLVIAMGLRSAYCNPNIRPQNIGHFKKLFMPEEWDDFIFCGAVAVGTKHVDEVQHERNLLESIVVK
jgi:hypothetical protein